MSSDDSNGGGGSEGTGQVPANSDVEASTEDRRASSPAKRDGGRWAPWVLVVLTLVGMGRVVANGFSGFDDEQTIWRNDRLNPPRFTGGGALWYWSNPHM